MRSLKIRRVNTQNEYFSTFPIHNGKVVKRIQDKFKSYIILTITTTHTARQWFNSENGILVFNIYKQDINNI